MNRPALLKVIQIGGLVIGKNSLAQRNNRKKPAAIAEKEMPASVNFDSLIRYTYER